MMSKIMKRIKTKTKIRTQFAALPCGLDPRPAEVGTHPGSQPIKGTLL